MACPLMKEIPARPVMDMSEQHNVVGMHIAGNASETVSLFTHIQRVFEIMQVRFP